jgi:hypothetical protein
MAQIQFEPGKKYIFAIQDPWLPGFAKGDVDDEMAMFLHGQSL